MGTRRPWMIVSTGLLLVLAGAVIFVLTRPATPEQRQAAARELLSGVRI